MDNLNYKRFDKTIPALYKESERNAGYDLFARLSGPKHIAPREIAFIPLNVATEIPAHAVGLVFQRSSTFRKWGLRLTNGVGVIDSLYCGDTDEWGAELQNMTEYYVTVQPGDKLCQVVFLPLQQFILNEVDVLGNPNRGGFGTSFDNAGALCGK